MAIQKIIERLKKGNDRFVSQKGEGIINYSASKNSPDVVILTCSESNIVPERIFDSQPGELFVVRNAGGIAEMTSIASIEYALAQSDIEVIVVLGHKNCQVVQNAIDGEYSGEYLNQLMSEFEPAISESGESAELIDVIKSNTRRTAEQVVKLSVVTQHAFEEGKVDIVSALFDESSGQVNFI